MIEVELPESTVDSGLFDRILLNLQAGTKNQGQRYSDKTPGLSGKNFIDIDNFIGVLYSLLESGGYLLGADDNDEPNKFLFTEEYPDLEANVRNTITFEIAKRAPASLSANSDPFSGTKHYRPLYLGYETDDREGGRVIHLQSMYDNMLRFRCWSGKVEHARKLATLLEGILNKYYYVLRQHVPVIVYEGRGGGRNSGEYGESRFQGIPLDLFVRTNERVMLREQEINCIQQNIQIGRSI